MGFSYMKSKLSIINGYGKVCLNNPLCGQISLATSPFSRAAQASRFRTISSVACLYGLQKSNASLLLCAGKPFIHSNRPLITVSNRGLPTVLNQALAVVPYRQLAGQLARHVIRSRYWRWLKNRKYGLMDFCIVFTVLFGTLQWVPYSNRLHMVFRSDKIENFVDGLLFQSIVKEKKAKILSPTSPESVRVQAILRDIVQAMHDSLGLKNDCHVSVYEPGSGINDASIPKAIGSLFFNRKKSMGSHSQPPGALLVSRPVDQRRHASTSRVDTKGKRVYSSGKIAQISPQKARRLGLKYGTKHLEGLNWEVMVVDSYIENASYISNGKIIFYTGFLKGKGVSDAEIATVLAHEVGHGVGRHQSENLMRALWYFALSCGILPPNSNLQLEMNLIAMIFAFFGRRRELEADYIGLLLMAAAGYDPRGAPEFYRNLGSEKEGILSTHPSGKRRGEKISREKVMKLAVEIYEQSKQIKSSQH